MSLKPFFIQSIAVILAVACGTLSYGYLLDGPYKFGFLQNLSLATLVGALSQLGLFLSPLVVKKRKKLRVLVILLMIPTLAFFVTGASSGIGTLLAQWPFRLEVTTLYTIGLLVYVVEILSLLSS